MNFFLFFLILIIGNISYCFSIDKNILIEAIEQQNVSEIVNFFEDIKSITVEEAHEFILEFYDHFISEFGPEILNNDEYVKNLEQCKAIYHAILEGYGFCFENSLIRYNNILSTYIILCRKKDKKKNKVETNVEIPGSMILGAVEILGGALVWIIPFPAAKVAGGAMIGDGIRRTFNGLEELDKENKQQPNGFGENSS